MHFKKYKKPNNTDISSLYSDSPGGNILQNNDIISQPGYSQR